MRSASVIGASVGAAAASSPAVAGGCFQRIYAPAQARPDSARKGRAGRPGISASTAAAAPANASGFGLPPSWRISAASAGPSTPPLVTTMPAAVDTSRAGICDTSPSPTVSVVNVAAASANGMPCRSSPMARPPMMLMTVMSSPAMASPRTNFAAPSIAP